MNRFGTRVRFRDTHVTGYLWRRLIYNGERMYIVLWDHASDPDPRPYTVNDLEPVGREERINQNLIPRSWAWDRKETIDVHATLEDLQQFRTSDFKRV
jgi:hypothetical protein